MFKIFFSSGILNCKKISYMGFISMLLQLYFGLLVFVGYIVVDTQEIVERAHLGDLDYVKHALTLFTDLVAVFVRILVIMVSLIVKQPFIDSLLPYKFVLTGFLLLFFSWRIRLRGMRRKRRGEIDFLTNLLS